MFEEDEEISEVSASNSVVSDAINSRKISKAKVRHEEEDEEEKESDWDNHSCDDGKNDQNDSLKNETWQSVLSEHKAREEHVVSLGVMNDEASCFEMMSQCRLALMRNEKEVDRARETREHNELIDEHNEMVKEMQHLGKKAMDCWLSIES